MKRKFWIRIWSTALLLSGTISVGHAQTIVTSSTVLPGTVWDPSSIATAGTFSLPSGQTTFQTGSSVLLLPGFTANATIGATFTAVILNVPPTGAQAQLFYAGGSYSASDTLTDGRNDGLSFSAATFLLTGQVDANLATAQLPSGVNLVIRTTAGQYYSIANNSWALSPTAKP